ncbi:MAG: AsmA-like C-terminal region-containing protein [Bacteroidota bacterium]|nr:AsmA-like C-terminal region-containing protein [Bacteroidota bacterium]
MNKKTIKILRRSLLALISVLLVFFIGIFIAIQFYQDEIKRKVIVEINSQIKTPIIISSQNINLNWFTDFPNISIHLSQFTIKSTNNFKDNLAAIGDLSLTFNAWEMIEGNYSLNHIVIKDATINLLTNASQKVNYDIFTADTSKTEPNTMFKLSLSKIILLRTKLNYIDKSAETILQTNLKQLACSGNLSDRNNEFYMSGQLKLKKLVIGNTVYADNKNLDLNIKVESQENYSVLAVSAKKLNIDGSPFRLRTKYIDQLNRKFINLELTGANNSIKSLISLLPGKYAKQASNYSSTGNISFKANYFGYISKWEMPNLDVRFSIQNSDIQIDKLPSKIKSVYATGIFSLHNGGKTKLELKKFSCNYEGNKVQGNLSILDFNQPIVTADLQGKIGLRMLSKLIQARDLNMTGTANINLNCQGKLSSLSTGKLTKNEFLDLSLILNNASLQLSEPNLKLNNINGYLNQVSGNLQIKDLQATTGKSDILINGYLQNFLSYLLGYNQNLRMIANLKSENLDISDFLIAPQNTKSNVESTAFVIPEHIYLDLNVAIAKMKYGKLSAGNLNSRLSVNHDFARASALKFDAMGGSIVGDITITNTPNHTFDTKASVKLNKLNLKKLFAEMGNFDQSYFTDKNIEGNITANIEYHSVWQDNLIVLPNTINVKAYINISNGELINYEPLVEMNKFLKKKDFSRIKINSLKNDIVISNQTIIIPEMIVSTDAGDLTMSGKHSFDNVMEYRAKLNATEWIKGKRDNYQSEFGEVQVKHKNGIIVYLIIKGTPDKISIKYDTKEGGKNFINGIAKEKNEFKKLIFKPKEPELPVDNIKEKAKEPDNLNKKNDGYELDWGDNE